MVLNPSSVHTERTFVATSDADSVHKGHLEAHPGTRDFITLLQSRDQGSSHLLYGSEFRSDCSSVLEGTVMLGPLLVTRIVLSNTSMALPYPSTCTGIVYSVLRASQHRSIKGNTVPGGPHT